MKYQRPAVPLLQARRPRGAQRDYVSQPPAVTDDQSISHDLRLTGLRPRTPYEGVYAPGNEKSPCVGTAPAPAFKQFVPESGDPLADRPRRFVYETVAEGQGFEPWIGLHL